jgi:DNA repair exonuclease SbcCD nuclease subunit
MKCLAVADLHIGKGAGSIPGRVADQESVWAQALQVGLDRGCDLVIFAGDATDKREPSNEERDAFQRPLVGYPLPVVAISGNHDLSHADKPTAVDLAGQGGLLRASREPELIRVGGVVVATLPYTSPARIRTWCHDRGIDSEPDDVFAELACQVLESLAADAARLYPGLPVVQVGHYPTSGWAVPSGFETSLMRTVVLPLERIVRCGFAAAVYGDIHKPGEINVSPLVLSPGSPLPAIVRVRYTATAEQARSGSTTPPSRPRCSPPARTRSGRSKPVSSASPAPASRVPSARGRRPWAEAQGLRARDLPWGRARLLRR